MSNSKIKKAPPCDHLKDNLKSSYAERLDWLEEANRFVAKISKSKAGKKGKRRLKLNEDSRSG